MRIDLASHKSLEQVRAFLEGLGADGSEPLLPERQEQYGHIQRSLVRFRYRTLRRAERGLVLEYLRRTTGLSRSQVTKLVGRSQAGAATAGPAAAGAAVRQQVHAGGHRGAGGAGRGARETVGAGYAQAVPAGLGRCTGTGATSAWRASPTGMSTTCARRSPTGAGWPAWNRTRPRQVAIGERRKPRPEGRPGFVRVDTVHQGDLDGVKGVYHINVVDEVTQYQAVGSVETISERHLLPVLEQLLAAFPFAILGFHSDNGSEYVNRRVAKLLEQLRAEFTKFAAAAQHRQRAVRGQERLGGTQAPGLRAHPGVLRGAVEPLQPRGADAAPSTFHHFVATPVRTPYERLRDLPGAEQYLRPGVDFAQLDAQERALTDLEAARRLNAQRDALFRELRAAA